MRRYSIIAALALAATLLSCEKMPEDVQVCGVGCKVKTIDMSWNGGECRADILSTGSFTVTIPEKEGWIVFKDHPSSRSLSLNGDVSLVFELDVNRSIPRSVEISLMCGSATSSFTINQDGLLERGLDIEQKNVLVPYEGGRSAAKVSTKMAASEFSFSTKYLESISTDWVSGVRFSGNFIVFDVEPNLSDTLVRHADITVSHAWGQGSIHITQYGAGCSSQARDIPALKQMLTRKGSLLIDSHYIVSGTVINDDAEGNGAENRLISVDVPDPDYSSRILYIQSEDGAEGIKLIFDSSCKDVASLYDRISFDAFGLTLTREADPVRYVISGIPASAVTESMRGDAPQPKLRSISALSDDDLYTLVKLENVEIPVRKGPFVPVNIENIDLVTAYPMILRDREGSYIYMMVNSDCSWSRDGNAMPQGSGSVTGVLVYETSDNFEWDTEKESSIKEQGVIIDYINGLGNIGTRQIRPVRRSGINLAEKIDGSFSSILYEWRYCDSLGINLCPNYDGTAKVLRPTWPVVTDPRTSPLTTRAAFYCRNNTVNEDLCCCSDFTHLGPYSYGGKISMTENGNGVTDSLGRSAHWYVHSYARTQGAIYSLIQLDSAVKWSQCNGAAWCSFGWSNKKYWCAEFPTSDLTTANSPLSVQFGTMNHIGYYGAPRKWVVEWSSDGTSWQRLAGYTVPDSPSTGNRKPYHLPGPKYQTVNLPDAAIGKDMIYVRLRPESNAGTGSSSSYYSASSSFNSKRYNAINYFGVRYNK